MTSIWWMKKREIDGNSLIQIPNVEVACKYVIYCCYFSFQITLTVSPQWILLGLAKQNAPHIVNTAINDWSLFCNCWLLNVQETICHTTNAGDRQIHLYCLRSCISNLTLWCMIRNLNQSQPCWYSPCRCLVSILLGTLRQTIQVYSAQGKKITITLYS